MKSYVASPYSDDCSFEHLLKTPHVFTDEQSRDDFIAENPGYIGYEIDYYKDSHLNYSTFGFGFVDENHNLVCFNTAVVGRGAFEDLPDVIRNRWNIFFDWVPMGSEGLKILIRSMSADPNQWDIAE